MYFNIMIITYFIYLVHIPTLKVFVIYFWVDLTLKDFIITLLNINTSSVPENQESTLIFIKYMHDIVLKISFLDTNSQNWSNGSHLKLLQKSLKIQYIFQKFLCMADGPDRTDFWIQKFFWLGPFFDLFFNLMDRKNAPSQKSC